MALFWGIPQILLFFVPIFLFGSQLQRLGYTSCAYHNGWFDYYDRNLTHCNLGYDQFLAFGNGLERHKIRFSYQVIDHDYYGILFGENANP